MSITVFSVYRKTTDNLFLYIHNDLHLLKHFNSDEIIFKMEDKNLTNQKISRIFNTLITTMLKYKIEYFLKLYMLKSN